MPITFQVGNPDAQTSDGRQERGACWPCSQYEKCLFHLKKHGGFKGQGWHNVGYRIITDAAENHGAKEDFCTCQNFVEVLQDRMLTGQQLRAEGKDGEIVSIIAQEGERVSQRFAVGFNARNEVVKPQRHLVPALKEAGIKVNLDDMNPALEFRNVTLEIVIPPYKAPNLQGDEYSATMQERERKRGDLEQDAETQAWESARAKQREEDATPTAKPESTGKRVANG